MNEEVDPQLSWICSLLNEINIYYWVDSGSLLVLVREGRLFDDDLDISLVWDAKKIFKLKHNLEQIGYALRVDYLEGVPYSIRILKKGKDKFKRTLDLKIFKKYGNYFISPTVYTPKYFLGGISRVVFLLVKFPFSVLLRIFLNCREYHNFFHNNFSIKAIWVINCSLLKKTITFKNTKIKIPLDSQNYLKYRYGFDWKYPNPYWNYAVDDAGFKLQRLKDFLKIKKNLGII